MNEGDVAVVLRETMLVLLLVAGPVLLVALVVGIVMSIVQAVTQISEPTLAFVPKVACIAGALFLAGAFMQTTLNTYARAMFDRVVATGGL
jgi:flagellar biosynthetic protein FliQ